MPIAIDLLLASALPAAAEPQSVMPYVAVTKSRVFVVDARGVETLSSESFSVSARDRQGRTIKGPLSSTAPLAVASGVLHDPAGKKRYELNGGDKTYREEEISSSVPSGPPTTAQIHAAANGTKSVRGITCLTMPARGPRPGGGMGVIGYNCVSPDYGGLDLESDLRLEAGGKVLHVVSEIVDLQFVDPPRDLMSIPKGFRPAVQ